MDANATVNYVEELILVHTGHHLDPIERDIILGTLHYKTLYQINSVYSDNYFREISSRLFRKLSEALGKKVTKRNMRQLLELELRRLNEATLPTQPLESTLQIQATSLRMLPTTSQDWGKAPHYSVFYGRTEELTTLKQWIVTERCRIVAVLGMGGIGKTALSVKLAQQIQDEFDYVIWRGLRNAPPIEKILAEIINFLSNQQETDLPEALEDKISRLLHYLSTSRCLLVLDNFESILLSNDLAGHYREGYEGYGELIRRVGETFHQSCLILTSREKPKEIALLETQTLPVRSLQLNGLDKTTAWEILQEKGLSDQQDSETLITLYRGNPLALYLVSAIIKDLFGGSVSNFLSINTLFIGDFGFLLEEQFNRLSELEKKIMYFLANQQKPVYLKQLLEHIQGDIRISKVKILDALQSLLRRSLLEKITEEREIMFTIQPVMIEYIKEHIQSENITRDDR